MLNSTFFIFHFHYKCYLSCHLENISGLQTASFVGLKIVKLKYVFLFFFFKSVTQISISMVTVSDACQPAFPLLNVRVTFEFFPKANEMNRAQWYHVSTRITVMKHVLIRIPKQ